MSEIHELQKKVLSLQNSEEINSIFSKLVSGKDGYKTIIEMKKELLKCKKCNNTLYGNEKFCPECGTKVEKEEKNN